MARPRMNPAARRTRQINVRVTEAEAAALAEQASSSRLTVAAYLRRRGLRRRVRALRERRLAAEDRRELNRIGVNLNQMTRLMHSGRAVHPGLWEAVERAAANWTAAGSPNRMTGSMKREGSQLVTVEDFYRRCLQARFAGRAVGERDRLSGIGSRTGKDFLDQLEDFLLPQWTTCPRCPSSSKVRSKLWRRSGFISQFFA